MEATRRKWPTEPAAGVGRVGGKPIGEVEESGSCFVTLACLILVSLLAVGWLVIGVLWGSVQVPAIKREGEIEVRWDCAEGPSVKNK